MRRAIFALTGGIGSGKSTVAAMLADHGAHVVDLDVIAHELTAPGGAALPALREAFGAAVFDAAGELERARLRETVFADRAAKTRLEAILHPMIRARALRQAELQRGVSVVDVPLLVESSGWRAQAERVLVVDCSKKTQVARVARRPGWDEAIARRVVAQQASRAQRRALADAVIVNDGIDLNQLAAEVAAVWRHWVVRSFAQGGAGPPAV
jgi:dephospho-CoA kinase